MIVEIPQLICCFISTKSEISLDHAAPAPVPRPSPHTGLRVTAHHLVNGDLRGPFAAMAHDHGLLPGPFAACGRGVG
jgi:hypothetical protein